MYFWAQGQQPFSCPESDFQTFCVPQMLHHTAQKMCFTGAVSLRYTAVFTQYGFAMYPASRKTGKPVELQVVESHPRVSDAKDLHGPEVYLPNQLTDTAVWRTTAAAWLCDFCRSLTVLRYTRMVTAQVAGGPSDPWLHLSKCKMKPDFRTRKIHPNQSGQSLWFLKLDL